MDIRKQIDNLIDQCVCLDADIHRCEGVPPTWPVNSKQHRMCILLTAMLAERDRIRKEAQDAKDRHSARVN